MKAEEMDLIKMAVAIQGAIRQQMLSHNGISSFFNREVLDFGAIPSYGVDYDCDQNAYYMRAQNIVREDNLKNLNEVFVPTYDMGACIDWPFQAEESLIDHRIEQFSRSFIDKIDNDAVSLLAAASTGDIRYATNFNKLLSKFMLNRKCDKKKPILVFVDDKMFHAIGTAVGSDNNNNKIIADQEGCKVIIFNLGSKFYKQSIKKYLSFWRRLINMFFGATVIIAQDNSGGFVMPIREEVTVFNNRSPDARQRVGFYGWTELGMGVLNSQDVMLGFC